MSEAPKEGEEGYGLYQYLSQQKSELRQHIENNLRLSIIGGGVGGQMVGMGFRTMQGEMIDEEIKISFRFTRSQHKARLLMTDMVELIIREQV